MELLPSRRTRMRLLVGSGVAALAIAYLIAVVPESAPGPVRSAVGVVRRPIVAAIEGTGRDTVVTVLALVAGGYALARLGRGRTAPAVAPAFVDAPPEEPQRSDPTAEEEFETELRRVTYWIDDPRRGGEEIRDRLRACAVGVVERTARSHEDADRAVAEGSWTDDRIAAAFLGDDPAPGYPLRARIRGWLRPDLAFEHRVERTVDAIHDRLEGSQ